MAAGEDCYPLGGCVTRQKQKNVRDRCVCVRVCVCMCMCACAHACVRLNSGGDDVEVCEGSLLSFCTAGAQRSGPALYSAP